MGTIDARTEMDRADDLLAQAYTAARQVGYRPGSPQVAQLEWAERSYQQARRRWCQEQAQRPAEEQPGAGLPSGRDRPRPDPPHDRTERDDVVIELPRDRTVDLTDPVVPLQRVHSGPEPRPRR